MTDKVTWTQFVNSLPPDTIDGSEKVPTLDGFVTPLTLRSFIGGNASITVGTSGSGATYECDGTADQVEINSAIDAATATKGTVEMLMGTYNTTASIVLKSNVRLIGAGVGATIIKGASSDYSILSTTSTGTTSKTGYSNIKISNLSVESVYGTCIAIRNTSDIDISSIEAYFSATPQIRQAIFLQHTDNVKIHDNLVHDYAGNGISVTGTDNFNIYGNIIRDGRDDGVDVDFDFLDTSTIPSNGGTVTNNTISGITNGNGIRVENSFDVSVSGNTVYDISNDVGPIGGILVNTSLTNDGGNITVTGNTVYNCVSSGIQSSGTNLSQVVITGNTVKDCGQTGGVNQRGGIVLNSDGVVCTGNNVTGVTKLGGDGAGILIYKKDDHIITSNAVTGCTIGISAWNGDTLQSYVGLLLANNIGTGNTTNYVLGAATTSSIRNNIGVNPEITYAQGNITGTTTFTRVNGSTITATATGNVTTTITNGVVAGDTLTLIITQDVVGGRTISKPANVRLVGGAFSPTATANAVDSWTLVWDGTNWREVSRSLNMS